MLLYIIPSFGTSCAGTVQFTDNVTFQEDQKHRNWYHVRLKVVTQQYEHYEGDKALHC